MATKINVGLSKKAGLENFGSIGSSCHMEFEIDNAALDHPEEFHRKVREAYSACRCAVEDELANHRARANGTTKADSRPTPPPRTEYSNSAPPARNENPYPISSKQLSFIAQLTKAVKGLTARKLDDYCRQTFGKTSGELSAKEGSRLIDDLKAAKDGGKEIG